MNITFIDFKRKDAVPIFQIIRDCYENLEIGGHTKLGLQMQIDGNKPIKLIENSRKIKYIVAMHKDQIVGIGGYDQKKIHTLFTSRKMHRFGIGQAILDEIINRAKKEGTKSLITWSTLYAQSFYTKNGFKIIKDIYIPEDKKDIKLPEMKRIF